MIKEEDPKYKMDDETMQTIFDEDHAAWIK